MKTVNVMGSPLPLIAPLQEGWSLVMHPNGPALANETSIMTLDSIGSSDGIADEVPEQIRVSAITEYVNRTWRSLKESMEAAA